MQSVLKLLLVLQPMRKKGKRSKLGLERRRVRLNLLSLIVRGAFHGVVPFQGLHFH